MRAHLKRIAAPRTWMINRKQTRFITKSKPGAHPLDASLPLGTIIRDFLKYCRTMRETKKILNNKQVLVDGRRRKDHRLPLGLFDVLSFPEIKKNFRILLDRKGRLTIKEVSSQEADFKPCKIIKKTTLPKNKSQLNLSDGRNILTAQKCKVGDTVIVTFPEQKIKEILELKKDAFVFLTKGKHGGDSGLLQEIKGEQAIYLKNNQKIETLKKYLFVLGTQKPVIDIQLDKQNEITK